MPGTPDCRGSWHFLLPALWLLSVVSDVLVDEVHARCWRGVGIESSSKAFLLDLPVLAVGAAYQGGMVGDLDAGLVGPAGGGDGYVNGLVALFYDNTPFMRRMEDFSRKL